MQTSTTSQAKFPWKVPVIIYDPTMSGARTPNDLLRMVYKAKLAEQAERFNEMKDIMREVAFAKKSLPEGERRLLAIAYKNHVAQLRTAWRCAEAARAKYSGKDATREAFAREYAQELAANAMEVCREVEQVLAALRDPRSSDIAAEAFYQKLEADYKRYRAELDPREVQGTSEAYQSAIALAAGLPLQDATRLGIALNYAVFKYEVEKDSPGAIGIVQRTLAECYAEPQQHQRDAYLAYQLLKDNLEVWTAEAQVLEPVPA